MRVIFLDSAPLGLLVHRRQIPLIDECHSWFEGHLKNRVRMIVPAIVDYELRRELMRLGHQHSIKLLNELSAARPDRYLKLEDAHLKKAAELWATVRRKGRPTADRHALDADVILSAQALSLGI